MSSAVETVATTNGSTTPTQRTSIPPRPVVHVSLPSDRPRRNRDIWSTNDAHLVALIAFLTGIVLAGSIAFALCHPSTPQCWLYVTFLCTFHFMEYYITAKYKPFDVTLHGNYDSLSHYS
jgi:hypothetical protein